MPGKTERKCGDAPPKKSLRRVQCRSGLGTAGGVISPAGNPAINRALEFIYRNCSQPIDVEDVVKDSELSRSALHYVFVEQLGKPPGQLFRQIRIEKAKRLLMENDLMLKEIADQCGFRSLNSFCVTFKLLTGVARSNFSGSNGWAFTDSRWPVLNVGRCFPLAAK